jgi:hypothetical protein
MADITAVLKQLQEERGRIDQAIAALAQLNGDLDARAAGNKGVRPPLSAVARRRIAAAQRARWAKVKAAKSGAAKSSSKPSGRVMSIAARRKIAAAQKARWAKLKKAA